MKTNTTELALILDRSGSMRGLEADTIGGCNGLLERQREVPGEVYVTTVLFDDVCETLHSHLPLSRVRPITGEEYYVRGCTALLDAVGRTIADMDRRLRAHPGRKVLIVITTDGMENASREYRYETVRAMVEERKARGWEFLFLGANMDAVAAAGRFGIAPDRAADYHADREGTRLNYEVLSDAVRHVRCSSAPLGSGWKARIEQDFHSRKPRR